MSSFHLEVLTQRNLTQLIEDWKRIYPRKMTGHDKIFNIFQHVQKHRFDQLCKAVLAMC